VEQLCSSSSEDEGSGGSRQRQHKRRRLLASQQLQQPGQSGSQACQAAAAAAADLDDGGAVGDGAGEEGVSCRGSACSLGSVLLVYMHKESGKLHLDWYIQAGGQGGCTATLGGEGGSTGPLGCDGQRCGLQLQLVVLFWGHGTYIRGCWHWYGVVWDHLQLKWGGGDGMWCLVLHMCLNTH
jgi:hypothetical protein